MADKSIFSNEEGSKRIEEKQNTKNSFLGRNLQKFGNSLVDLGKDTVTSIADEAKGIASSLVDSVLPKGLRRSKDGDEDFIIEDVSIANRHKDAISGILNSTFNGNLFDAGASALNLLNFGTKWKLVYDQYTDKDSYPFRYWYHFSNIPDGRDDLFNFAQQEGEQGGRGYIELLDSIEDPTVLGFSLRIDYENSPLFKTTVGNKTTSDKNDDFNFAQQEGQQGADTSATSDPLKENPPKNSALEFIDRYKAQHRELVMCEEYLEEFSIAAKKIFEAPETVVADGVSYNNPKNEIPFKNHYIYEIKGLDKLDNYFVEYSENNKDHETLEIVLGEDVRMFTNRMKFLYKNLTWSYNMGKKLIPENKLRFNLYIKVSDIRKFTSGFNKEIVEDKYSRVIYELKDCEFLFDESLNPSSLKVGGFNGVNEDYANLNLKIKYRKVNRIFYSHMFANNNDASADMYIGDKFYEPHTNNTSYIKNYREELSTWRFHPDYTKTRVDKSNNMPVKVSLDERLDRLKNGGLFVGEDNNDTALNRFAKGIGNEAVKAGASLVDEGLQKVKDNLNNQQSAVDGLFGNNFAGSVRDFLDGNTGKKTTTLGDLHPDTDINIIEPNRDVHPVVNNNITNPNDDVHPTLNQPVVSPNDDLHPTLNQPIVNPNDDLHPTLNQPVVSPNDDLHPTLNQPIVNPNDDLHPTLNQPVVSPNDDLHPTLNQPVVSPNNDLHPTLNQPVVSPNNDLHPQTNQPIVSPNNDLHPQTNNPVVSPNDDKHPNVNQPIVNPNEDVHPNVNGTVSLNEVNVNGKVNSDITAPDDDKHPQVKKGIDSPKTLSDNFSKFIRKDPQQDKARKPDEDCED